MVKRRRERDRPKASNDAPYHPNKRILLSYDSEEDHDDIEAPAGTGHPIALDAATANYQIEEYPNEDRDGGDPRVTVPEDGPETPSAREKVEEELQVDQEEQEAQPDQIVGDTYTKFQEAPTSKSNRSSVWRTGIGRNCVTGQRPALGSLAYEFDEDDECEDEECESSAEAMAYLRAVRAERRNLPEVLTSLHLQHGGWDNVDGSLDERGFLSEGAYIARPVETLNGLEESPGTVDPQEAYTAALKKRFLKQRKALRAVSNIGMQSSPEKKGPTSLPKGSKKAYSEWISVLNTTPPLCTQVSSLNSDSTRRLIQLIQRIHLVEGKQINNITSVWIWALLAHLDDVGTMDSDQVYTIREFGKQAVLAKNSFSDPAAFRRIDSLEVESDANTNASNSSQMLEESTRSWISDRSSSSNLKAIPVRPESLQNTLATLDMIISIVGDIFGQRDLLQYREKWKVTKEGVAADTSRH